MTKFLRAVLPMAVAAIAPLPALGADYDPPIVIDAVDEYVPVEVGNGWYLRGDLGYAFSIDAGGAFTYRTFDPLTTTYTDNNFATARLGTDVTYGVGFGYQYNEWIRGDLTLDSFQGRFNGTTVSAAPCDPILVGTTCRSEDVSSFTAISLMANGYIDLGTYAGFTPYVGAGAGVTHINWATLGSRAFCVDGVALCPPPGGVVAATTHDGLETWRFSYAFMGGVAFDVTRNLKVDLGYKYTHVAGGPMFAFDAGSTGAGATGVQGRDPGFSQHEVRVGLRYSLW